MAFRDGRYHWVIHGVSEGYTILWVAYGQQPNVA
jgi:hypothetical protein